MKPKAAHCTVTVSRRASFHLIIHIFLKEILTFVLSQVYSTDNREAYF